MAERDEIFDDEDDDSGDYYGYDGISADEVIYDRLVPHFEMVVSPLEALSAPGNNRKFSVEFEKKLHDEKITHVVFHNASYGCTGGLAVFTREAAIGAGWSSNSIFTLVRARSGCGSSEIICMQNALDLDPEVQLLLNHVLLTKVFPEPGPKLVFGVCIYGESDFAGGPGWEVAHSFTSPHDQWDDRNLHMWHLDARKINNEMEELPKPIHIPKYAYIPMEWCWGDDHSQWRSYDFLQRLNMRKIGYTKYLAGDVSNLTYLNNLISQEKMEAAFGKEDGISKDKETGSSGLD